MSTSLIGMLPSPCEMNGSPTGILSSPSGNAPSHVGTSAPPRLSPHQVHFPCDLRKAGCRVVRAEESSRLQARADWMNRWRCCQQHVAGRASRPQHRWDRSRVPAAAAAPVVGFRKERPTTRRKVTLAAPPRAQRHKEWGSKGGRVMRSVGLDLGARHIAFCEVRDGLVVDRTSVRSLEQLKGDRAPIARRPHCLRGIARASPSSSCSRSRHWP